MIFGVGFRYNMMKYAVITGNPLLVGIRNTYGKGWGIVCGVLGCMQNCIFAIGNFIGGGLAVQLLFPGVNPIIGGTVVMVLAFLFLLFRDLYRRLELWFKIVLLIKLVTFLIVAISAGSANPALVDVRPINWPFTTAAIAMMMAMLGTNVSLSTAANSTTLVKDKGYTEADIRKKGLLADCIIGLGLMFLITLILILAGARALGGTPIVNGLQFGTLLAAEMGEWARYIIGIGFFTICISTIVFSPMCGIDLLLQGLGKGTEKGLIGA
jgi:Mn2+/Fe2+ NRAMP family transporter